MNDAQVKHMVARFLTWRLPENFCPDAGISFKAEFNEHTAWPMKHEPIGTNLFDATQAEAMIRHLIEGLPNGCVNHPDRAVRTNLDGDDLCQECADAWARGEGDAAAERAFNDTAFEAMNRKLP